MSCALIKIEYFYQFFIINNYVGSIEIAIHIQFSNHYGTDSRATSKNLKLLLLETLDN